MEIIKAIRGFIKELILILLGLAVIITIFIISYLFIKHPAVSDIENIKVILTGFTALSTLILAMAGIVYVVYPKPKVFAYLRHEKLSEIPHEMEIGDDRYISKEKIVKKSSMLGIYVENAGRGVAWNGRIKVFSPAGKELLKDGFTRLQPMGYPFSIYEYPTDKDLPTDSSVKKNKEIVVEVDYEDENEKGYHYQIKIGIPEEILGKFQL